MMTTWAPPGSWSILSLRNFQNRGEKWVNWRNWFDVCYTGRDGRIGSCEWERTSVQLPLPCARVQRSKQLYGSVHSSFLRPVIRWQPWSEDLSWHVTTKRSGNINDEKVNLRVIDIKEILDILNILWSKVLCTALSGICFPTMMNSTLSSESNQLKFYHWHLILFTSQRVKVSGSTSQDFLSPRFLFNNSEFEFVVLSEVSLP